MIKLLKFLKINFFYFSFNNKKMVITRENFAELSLHHLLYNIYSYAEYVIKGNCASFSNDYIDYRIEFSERQWDETFLNFNFVIQSLLHHKHFDFSNICCDDLHIIIDLIKK